MNLGLDMSMRLQQKLSFQMIQSLKLLQVNTLQLEQLLKTELEMNPVLEVSEEIENEQEENLEVAEKKDEAAESKEKSDEADNEVETSEDEINWEEYLEEGFNLNSGSDREEVDRSQERYEPASVYQTTLDDHLNNLLNEKNLPEKKRLLVQFLIGSLDADGYLRMGLDTIADVTHTDQCEVNEALTILQSMEPVGVGARDLRECFMLQLQARGLQNSLVMRILTETWNLFEKVKIPEIARTLMVGPREVQDAIAILRTLNPKPGYQVNSERSATILPDLIVEKIDGKFIVMLNDRSVPSLHINRAYMNMLKRGSSAKKDVKNYIREKLNGATWLIRAIEQRKTTMVRVMYAIVNKQKDFFEKGPPNLFPLKLQDIADIVEMHISTISRVTNNKYVQTPHGIFELKYFFTEAMGQDAGGEDVSSEKIKNRIHQLINDENTKKPLSDQRIADILSRENLQVARRTVAKYREAMKLLPARMRLKYD